MDMYISMYMRALSLDHSCAAVLRLVLCKCMYGQNPKGARTDEEDGGADPPEPFFSLALSGKGHDARKEEAHDHHGTRLG